MNEGDILGRGISFPPRISRDGRLSWSQGSENIRESIRVVLLTEPQERLLLPEFGGGLQSFLFEPNTVTTHRLMQERIQRALERWVPRIKVENIDVTADPNDGQTALVSIMFSLIATGTQEQVNLAVRVGG